MSPIVSIIMGSTSDLPVMEKAAQLLNDLHVPFEMNALCQYHTAGNRGSRKRVCTRWRRCPLLHHPDASGHTGSHRCH